MAQALKSRRFWKWIAVAVVVIAVVEVASFLVLDRSNPAVKAEPNWDAARTRELFAGACFDCHSNETVWPWYTAIAPVSWLTYRDVAEGRDTLNFSEWSGGEESLEVIKVMAEDEMPPFYYVWMHSQADLSDDEKAELMQGWANTLAQSDLTGLMGSDGGDD